MGDRTRVTLDIETASLRELVEQGDLVYRIWLTEHEPGVYRLTSRNASDASGRGLLRALIAAELPPGEEPPLPEPTKDEAGAQEWWTDHFEQVFDE